MKPQIEKSLTNPNQVEKDGVCQLSIKAYN